MNAPAQRSADGRLLPGNTVGIAGARPRNIVTELKIRYENRIPELLENLFILAEPDKPYMVQIAATKEILDRLIGKPQVTIDAVTTKVDVAALYLRAMQRANSEIVPSNSHIVPSEPATPVGDEGKPCSAGTSENGTIS
jgi:hypothetical protein